MKRRPVGVPWWGEVCLSVRTPWDRAYSAGVLSCIGAIARAPERELVRRSEGCWCQGGPLWPAETLCFTYPQGWYRDPAAMGTSFNLTDGIEITFEP